MNESGFDFSKIMGMLGGLQENLSKITEEMKKARFTGESGGGLVKVTLNGIPEAVSVELDNELFKEPDKEMTEDLIVAAFNKAIIDSRQSGLKGQMPNLGGLLSTFGIDSGDNSDDNNEDK